jgi:hypothetical protein
MTVTDERLGHARQTLVECHHNQAAARLKRYRAFDRFYADAPARIARRFVSLGIGEYYRTFYDLCVVPGGAAGGAEPRIVDVFFGARPFDQSPQPPVATPAQPPRPSDQPEEPWAVSTVAPNSIGPKRPTPYRFLAERGTMLRYEQIDSGTVLLTLWPARTEGLQRKEDAIILAWMGQPADLESPAVLDRHLHWLLAYMAYTSLDGVIQPGQQCRRVWLWAMRPWIEDGKHRSSRVWQCLLWVGKWSLTVGLSGTLLYGIQRLWPLPDSVTPAVQKAAYDVHEDQVALNRQLSEITVALRQLAAPITRKASVPGQIAPPAAARAPVTTKPLHK